MHLAMRFIQAKMDVIMPAGLVEGLNLSLKYSAMALSIVRLTSKQYADCTKKSQVLRLKVPFGTIQPC